MEDLDRFEQLLKQHSFKNLSEEEKNLAYQFVSTEEEYESLRASDAELKNFFDQKLKPVPSDNTFRRIKESRQTEKYPEGSTWVRASVPAYAVAMLIIVVGGVGWWSGTTFGSEKILVEKIVPRIDTVLVVSKPDTIIRERIIYVQSIQTSVTSIKSQTPVISTTKGVNMKEKEELEGLLVSGSY